MSSVKAEPASDRSEALPGPATPGRTYAVSSVDNTLTLLGALRDHTSLAVKEGAELLGVAPSTAHRLLSTLQSHGFVTQDPSSRRYGAGPALLAVALASLRRVDVRRIGRPHLVAFAAETRETVSLAVAEGVSVRFIDSVEGPELIRVRVADGRGAAGPCQLGRQDHAVEPDRRGAPPPLPDAAARRADRALDHVPTDAPRRVGDGPRPPASPRPSRRARSGSRLSRCRRRPVRTRAGRHRCFRPRVPAGRWSHRRDRPRCPRAGGADRRGAGPDLPAGLIARRPHLRGPGPFPARRSPSDATGSFAGASVRLVATPSDREVLGISKYDLITRKY